MSYRFTSHTGDAKLTNQVASVLLQSTQSSRGLRLPKKIGDTHLRNYWQRIRCTFTMYPFYTLTHQYIYIYIYIYIYKAWTAIDRLLIIWKSDLTDKMKRSFFQAASDFEEVLEATPNKAANIRSPTSHHENYPSQTDQTCRTLLEKQGRSHN